MLDYPGQVAAICFFQGCQWRCPFCHNPSLVLPDYFKHKKALIKTGTTFRHYLSQRRGLIDAVVVSGGEPLLQDDLLPFLEQLKESGFLVKLDTNGLLPNCLAQVIKNNLVDYVALDYKNCLQGLAKTTGTSCPQAEDNYLAWQQSLALLNASSLDFSLRTTVVKELHPQVFLEAMAYDLKTFGLRPGASWFWQSFQRKAPVLADFYLAPGRLKHLSAYRLEELSALLGRAKEVAAPVSIKNAC